MNPAVSTTATTAASSVRPRNRRLQASKDEEGPDRSRDHASDAHFTSPFSSPRQSRTASPVPRSHMPGSTRRDHGDVIGRRAPSNGLIEQWHASRLGQQTPSTVVSGLWGSSWSAIQGLASTVLNGDPNDKGKGRATAARRPRPRDTSSDVAATRWLGHSTGPAQWGPQPVDRKAEDAIAAGTRESREALIRAKRRDGLLSANEEAVADASGKFKRRVSDDRGVAVVSCSVPPAAPEQEVTGDELVYLHHVTPQDTIAGVVLRYHCQPAVFRKANRLWPNDPIQSRRMVVLPVHACGVKGRPVSSGSMDHQASKARPSTEQGSPHDVRRSPSPASPKNRRGRRRSSSSSPSLDLPELSNGGGGGGDDDDDRPWKHDSWVLIDGQPEPVEIVRMQRKTLGYFPPRRRRASRSSDVDMDSASMSLDLPRPRTMRSRDSKSRSNSSSYFSQHLHGPGGVGNLGGVTRSPGPSQDVLQRYLAAPPLPLPLPLPLPHLAGVVTHAAAGPRDSFESVASNVSATAALENVGSAIEGWVKRVASRAAAALAENTTGVGVAGVVGGPGCRRASSGGEEGDLIELSGGLDHAVQGNARDIHGPSMSASASASTTAADDADLERALRERFPMRGRMGGNIGMEGERKKDD